VILRKNEVSPTELPNKEWIRRGNVESAFAAPSNINDRRRCFDQLVQAGLDRIFPDNCREMQLPESPNSGQTTCPLSVWNPGILPVNREKPTFYSRWGIGILVVSLLCVPVAFFGAGKAVQSNVNKVEDWLPKTFAETHELEWFRANFPTDQFVIISWEGCKLGGDPSLAGSDADDPRIEQLMSLLKPDAAASDEDQNTREARLYVKSLSTGRQMLNQLTAPPSNIAYEKAVDRLIGTLVGPDRKQTCVVVGLNPQASGKLKLLLGSGQRRIFRPNVPPGLLRRAVAEVGIDPDQAHFGGPPVDNVAIDEEGEKTLVRLAGAAALLGLGLAYWSLRSVLLTSVVFFCGVVSAAASLAMIWATGETVDAIVLSMPSLVYVLAISGAVHFINYYRDAVMEEGLHGATERAVIHAFKPALLCSTTTAIGLISLYSSDLTPIRKFGLYSATGVMILLAVLYLLLPTIIHLTQFGKRWEGAGAPKAHDSESQREDTPGEARWARFGVFVVRNYLAVGSLSVAATIFIGIGLSMTRTSIDLLELFDPRARILQDYRWLEKNLGRLVPLEIVVRFNRDSQASGVRTQDSTQDDLYRLTFLERIETTALIQESIEREFGEGEGKPGIVGQSLSAANFLPSLPPTTGDTASFIQRMGYNTRLNSSRDSLVSSGFLKVDSRDDSELWRISLRVAAFAGVDYGQFVHQLRDKIEPLMVAHEQRVQILKQLAEWHPEKKYAGAKVYLWEQPFEDRILDQKHRETVDALEALLVKARVKVHRGEPNPGSVPVVTMQQLNQLDGVILAGDFTKAHAGTINWAVSRVIDLRSEPHAQAPNISAIAPENQAWLSAVYTGVVPIVYKAQRELLKSLIESTLWSFLTITPLMMFVSRSFRAGAVAMIPNVLPVICIFGAMGWLNIAIDIGSMMSASIALGVAVDDTIHFLSWFRADLDRLRDRKAAIVQAYKRCAIPTLQAALISGVGLSVFAFSTFTPTQRFGWLMLTILIAGVISELVMLPALIASPLGRVFEPHSSRRRPLQRLWLIARYELRKRSNAFDSYSDSDRQAA
jgi:predicted RND superfamily exporter protein